jgi:NAD(P)-dependent dehydrogenase (short-subunit alcohol dehydrogenase family)
MTTIATYRRTPQLPLPSGFSPGTTAQEALAGQDLGGLTAIVTGGYSGLGLETTRVLARAGARVIVPVRTPGKAGAALAHIPGVVQARLNLLDPASIDTFARDVQSTEREVHMLVDSAGIMATPLSRDDRGFESQFATNHLGHFQLAARLWPALRRAGEKGGPSARVVSVSSRGHRIAPVDFDDPHFLRKPYDKWKAYGQSKTANVLFALGLDARGAKHNVRAFSLHPGSIVTDLVRHLSDEDLLALGGSRAHPKGHVPVGQAAGAGGDFKTIEQGAATAVWCATSPQLLGKGGVYCENVDIARTVANADPSPAGVRAWAVDDASSERLWRLSESSLALVFP